MAYGSVVQDTAHVAEAQARLVSQYQGQSNFLGLVAVLAARAQLVENALWAVLTTRALSSASGQQLDNLGKVVGLARSSVPGGNVDAVYATWLRVQILVNASSGTAPNLIAIVQAVADVGATVQVMDSGTASVVVRVGAVALSQPSALAAALQLARAAGVHLVMEYLATDASASFVLDGTSVQALDFGLFAGAL